MRLATLRLRDGSLRAARVENGGYIGLPFSSVGDLLASCPEWRDLARRATGPEFDSSSSLAPVVPAPQKIICVGLNYASHVSEMGRPTPEYPTCFAKYASALIGARDRILLSEDSDQADWEAELACVIGSPVRAADRSAAIDAIGGYTVANDVSMRDWQHRTTQWLVGKNFDNSTPLGPFLVTPDELPGRPGRPALEMECTLDGEKMQCAVTDELIFDAADIVSYLSRVMTLFRGDVILTGTPGGVGSGRTPPRFLAPGSRLVTRIELLGELVNVCAYRDRQEVPSCTELGRT